MDEESSTLKKNAFEMEEKDLAPGEDAEENLEESVCSPQTGRSEGG